MTSALHNAASRRPRFSRLNELWPWLCAASVALSLLMLGALLTLLLVRGLGHFWPATLEEITLSSGETFAGQAVREVALPQQAGDERLYFTGNQDIDGARWHWVAIEQSLTQLDVTSLTVTRSRARLTKVAPHAQLERRCSEARGRPA